MYWFVGAFDIQGEEEGVGVSQPTHYLMGNPYLMSN
jgi:hypothetical protein